MAAKNKKRIEELAKKNPLVDVELLKEAQALVKEFRKQGLGGPEYDIEPPYGSRPSRSRSKKQAQDDEPFNQGLSRTT